MAYGILAWEEESINTTHQTVVAIFLFKTKAKKVDKQEGLGKFEIRSFGPKHLEYTV